MKLLRWRLWYCQGCVAVVLSLVIYSSSANDRCPASETGTGDRCCQPAETRGTINQARPRGQMNSTSVSNVVPPAAAHYSGTSHASSVQQHFGIDLIEIISFAVLKTLLMPVTAQKPCATTQTSTAARAPAPVLQL